MAPSSLVKLTALHFIAGKLCMTQKNNKKQQRKTFVFHPLLFGCLPILALVAYNIKQLDFLHTVRSIVVTLLVSIFVFILSVLLLRDRHKGGLLASLTLILVFTYGHVYDLLENGSLLGHHRLLVLIWLAIFVLGMLGIVKLKTKLDKLSTIFNLVSVLMAAVPIFLIIKAEISPRQTPATNPSLDEIWQPASSPAGSPDVYFIVLDSYARSDMLETYHHYDNSAFVQSLQRMGFYVADCSKSNYSNTPSSIASTLNMDYLDQFAAKTIRNNQDRYDLGETIKYSKTAQQFGSLGYQFITFETNTWWLDITHSDQFISQSTTQWQKLLDFRFVSDFEQHYLHTTALRLVDEFLNTRQNQNTKGELSIEKARYDQVLHGIDQLDQLPATSNPKFVYLHLMAPTSPYVFSSDGSFQYTPANAPGYVDEIEYLNQRVLQSVRQIISRSDTPPVILIEGDHGLNPEVQNANLMAFYLPDDGDQALYPTITSVNSFRIVFNKYFDADYPLLEDIAYSSAYQTPFDFEIVDYPCAVE